jgi:HAD superfamily hydrolase (TIGR01509 family)
MNAPEINAIIFDLGGVILDIDYNRTVRAFQALEFEDFDQQYSKMKQSGVFDRIERGEIDEAEFVSIMQQSIPHASQEEIIDAWNAIILDFPSGRLDYINEVRKKLPIFLLSNTNEIHLKCFDQLLFESTNSRIKDHFNKAYLSHEMSCRKPEPEAWKIILEEQGLKARTTLFIDDSPQHIAAARNLGLPCIHLQSIDELERELAPFLTQFN